MTKLFIIKVWTKWGPGARNNCLLYAEITLVSLLEIGQLAGIEY